MLKSGHTIVGSATDEADAIKQMMDAAMAEGGNYLSSQVIDGEWIRT